MVNYNYDHWDLVDLDTEAVDSIAENGKFWIACKDTIFYVEGGGQASDKGEINGNEVLEVKNLNGKVYHLLDKNLSGKVHMAVDRAQRRINAQVHTAEHLVCTIINKQYNAPTVAFFNDNIEFGAEMAFKDLNDDILKEIEDLCNHYILEDIPVEISYPSEEEAFENIKAIKEIDDDTKAELKMEHDYLRAVKIGDVDYDMCACIHVPSLRHLQMIKVERYEKTTRGYRVYFLVGDLLNNTYTKQYQILKTASKQLSTPVYDINEGIEKLQSDLKKTREELTNLKELQLESVAKELINSEDRILVKAFEGLDAKQVSKLASMVTREASKVCFFVADMGERMHVVITHSKDIDINSGELFKSLSATYDLRGGGNPFMAQGGGNKNLAILDAFKAIDLGL